MADEDPWGTDDTEETPAAPPSKPATPKSKGSASKGGTPAKGSKAGTPSKTETGSKVATPGSKAASPAPGTPGGSELPEAEVPPQDDPNHRRPITLYKHWVRPKFLQYKYMYDYRTNYYNDVIDYLDKRSRGVNVDVPRAQTWAERVLRTHTNPSALDHYKAQKKEDHHLIQTIAATIRTHNYHTKAYINRKYSSVMRV